MSPVAPPAIGARPDEAAAPAAAPPPSLLRRLLVPIATLLLGLGAGFGGAFFSGQKGEKGEATEEAAEAEGEHAATAEDPAAMVKTGGPDEAVTVNPAAGTSVTNLGAFTVNLRGGAGGRVLRLEVQIETPSEQAPGISLRAAQIRDSIITAVSDYTWAELEGAEGKTRLRDELISRVNGVVAPDTIGRLYFTQFVIQ